MFVFVCAIDTTSARKLAARKGGRVLENGKIYFFEQTKELQRCGTLGNAAVQCVTKVGHVAPTCHECPLSL